MQVLYINNDGAGFADHVQAKPGTTVQTFFFQKITQCSPADYLSFERCRVVLVQHRALHVGPVHDANPSSIRLTSNSPCRHTGDATSPACIQQALRCPGQANAVTQRPLHSESPLAFPTHASAHNIGGTAMRHCQFSPSRAQRVALGIILTMLLSLLLPSRLWGDTDAANKDGDQKPCAGGGQADPANGNLFGAFVCPKEYFGEVSGVHWYEGWKALNCTGPLRYVASDVSNAPTGCTGTICNKAIEYRRKTKVQKVPCPKGEKFKPKVVGGGQYESGFARVPNGPDTYLYFKLFTITKEVKGKPLRVGYIGVETTEEADFQEAKWNPEFPPAKAFVHEIIVYPDGIKGAEIPFTVSTIDDVQEQ